LPALSNVKRKSQNEVASGLENRSKDDVQKGLEDATRDCGRDRQYAKGKRSFRVLAELDPEALKGQLPHFERFCGMLEKRLAK
jgi:hypothetical protein